MPPKAATRPQTEGSSDFDPVNFFEKWEKGEIGLPEGNDFQTCILRAFSLPADDSYVYRATAEVTLAQAQAYLDHGDNDRLLEWYRDDEGKQLPAPPLADIQAYTSIFSPTTSTEKALTGFLYNSKKKTLRMAIARRMNSLYEAPPTPVPKLRNAPCNPYLDLWTWTCPPLCWAGPDPGTSDTRISHALLPVLYHHFGCIVPSFDALATIRQFARGRPIIDLGSGNGYWTYMLRRTTVPGLPGSGAEVVPVDNGLSAWRTTWIGDTIAADGVKFLSNRGGAKDHVLLLVYPQVGADFTGRVLRAYKGDTIIVAGTQNGNGFTGFKDEVIDEWMEREMPLFEKKCQIPLPSFAGKDEALFAFVKKDRP